MANEPKTVGTMSANEYVDAAFEKAKADNATEMTRAMCGRLDERTREITSDVLATPSGRRRLFAAAHELLRALVAVEWSGDVEWPECPECRWSKEGGAHRDGCPLDAALTDAGLETQEQRDRARGSA